MIALFASLNWEALVPWAVFGCIAAGAWWLLDFFSAERSRANERLDELKNPLARRRGPEGGKTAKKRDPVTRALEKASPALSKPLQPKTEQEVGRLKARLSAAGFRSDAAVSMFLGLKFAGLVVGFLLGGGTMLLTHGLVQKTLYTSVITGGLFFYMPEIVVWLATKQRKDAIFLGLPDVLDLLVVCVESGLGLDQAMRRVADEMRRTQPVLCDELSLCNLQLQMGRARSDVLHELGNRTGVDDLRALSAILIQAEKFGSSVALALRVQSDSMRTRRRQLAEERAAKTAVKLIFPLVLFIFPGIFVVLVGPAAITMVRQMFPVMGG